MATLSFVLIVNHSMITRGATSASGVSSPQAQVAAAVGGSRRAQKQRFSLPAQPLAWRYRPYRWQSGGGENTGNRNNRREKRKEGNTNRRNNLKGLEKKTEHEIVKGITNVREETIFHNIIMCFYYRYAFGKCIFNKCPW